MTISASVLLVAVLSDRAPAASHIVLAQQIPKYADGRPAAKYRLEAKDQGVVLRHGDAPGQCDQLGARDVWVWEHGGTYYMHYDGAGPKGWLACLATSKDLTHWTKNGPALDFGKAGEDDSASASYGVTFFDGKTWHMFYLGTPNVTPAPDLIPGFPYLTMKAHSQSPAGPWLKQKEVIPFRNKPGTYYSVTASPGHVMRHDNEYLMFFSASTDKPILRTIGLAQTKDLNGTWTIGDNPLVPMDEQVENTSLYYDEATGTWFLFTNHVGTKDGLEYTDAIWVYWTKDLTRWNRENKAVVLDGRNCNWSKHIIGLPSVLKVGNRLAIFYDGNASDPIPQGVKSHMDRDVGVAWLDLPLVALDDDGFVSMFNGKDLSGWEGTPDGWTVQDGILTGESTPEKPCKKSHYLYWKGGEPANFEMRCSWRLTGDANSGVQLRSNSRPNWDTWGFQADMDSAGTYVGCLYHHAGGLIAQRGEKVVIDANGKKAITKFADPDALLENVKKGEWNTYRILADGPRLSLWINDVLMCEAETHDSKLIAQKNILALQMHQGPPMKAEFKDLRIRMLP